MNRIQNILGIRKTVMMNRSDRYILLMEEITDKDEEIIDNSKEEGDCAKKLFINSKGIKIIPDNIYLYGEVNIHSKSDIALINKHDVLTKDIYEASNVPSKFSYNKGIIFSNNEGIFKYTDTWDKIKWFKYNHCLLGKPKKVIIYKIDELTYKQRYIFNKN